MSRPFTEEDIALLKEHAGKYAALQKKFYAIHKENILPPVQVGVPLLEAIISAKPTYSGGDLSEPLNVIDKCMLIAIACSVGLKIQEIEEEWDFVEYVMPYLVNTIDREGNFIQNEKFLLPINMDFVISRAIDLFKRSTHTQQAANILQCSDVVWRSISRLTRSFAVAFKDENDRKHRTTLSFISPDVSSEESEHLYVISPIFFYLYKKCPNLRGRKNKTSCNIIDFGKFCEGFRKYGEEYVDLSLTIWANKPLLERGGALKIPIKYSEDATRQERYRQRKRVANILKDIDPTTHEPNSKVSEI